MRLLHRINNYIQVIQKKRDFPRDVTFILFQNLETDIGWRVLCNNMFEQPVENSCVVQI